MTEDIRLVNALNNSNNIVNSEKSADTDIIFSPWKARGGLICDESAAKS